MPTNGNREAMTSTVWIARTAVLLALTVAIQMLGLPQPVTGPAVNAMLILTALLVTPAAGVVVGIFTPVIALWRGILPAPLAPMVPFIALGNALLVLVFVLIYRRQASLAVVTAAIVKFVVLSTAVRVFVTVPEPVALAMQTPQLVTAIVGGFVALIIYRILRNHSSFAE